jgi:ankyrin repeat protein
VGVKSYDYWYRLDSGTLSRLQTHYDDLLAAGNNPMYTGETLVGMAISHSAGRRPGYGAEVVKLVRAAAELDYVPAQGFIKRLEDAHNQVRKTEESRNQLRDWLLNAASTGSYIALQDLSAEDRGLFDTAKTSLRKNGGYNQEMAETAKTKMKLLLENPHKFCEVHDIRMAVDLQGNTILHVVAVYGPVELIKLLTVEGAAIDALNDKGETALYQACMTGNSDSVEVLVSLSADASITSRPHNISCLHWLFNFDTVVMDKMVEMLKSKGAEVGAVTLPMSGEVRRWKYWAHFPFHWPQGSAMHWASFTGSKEAVEALIQSGARIDDLNAEDEACAQTALSVATHRADQSMVDFLLSKGANATFLDSRGCSPAHMLVPALDWQHRTFRMLKALHWWVYHGTFENHLAQITRSANALKSAGSDLQRRTHRLSTGFHVPQLIDAVNTGDGGVALGLLAAGASANCVDELGRSPLHLWIGSSGSWLSAYPTYEKVCENLLRGMENVNARDSFGRTIVHCAIGSLDFEYLMELFKLSDRPVDINAADEYGETPLLESLNILALNANGKSEAGWFSHVLQQYGANMDARDHDGRDFIWNVCHNRALFDHECLSLVERRLHGLGDQEQRRVLSESIDKRTGETALHMAIENKYTSVVHLFIHLGLDINMVCNGRTALDKALMVGQNLREQQLRTWLSQGKLVLRDKLEPRGTKDSLFEETHTESDLSNFVAFFLLFDLSRNTPDFLLP